MIKAIDETFCNGCGLCVSLCQMDVIRLKDGKAYIAYPGDCCHCLECFCYCPVEAITMAPGVPKRFNLNTRWQQVKDALNLKW